MRANSLYTKAAKTIDHWRAAIARRKDRELVSGLPDYLLKDIGWPSAQSDCCTDRAR